MSMYLKTREYKLNKHEQYQIRSKGLLRSWTVIDENCKFIPILSVEDIVVKAPRKQPRKICIEELRNYVRNDDTHDNCIQLENVESILFNHQLIALQYYTHVSNEDLFNSVFTKDLNIKLLFGNNSPDEILIREEYYEKQ